MLLTVFCSPVLICTTILLLCNALLIQLFNAIFKSSRETRGFSFAMFGSHEDVGFHYMMNPAHASDTLFLVAEADFRYYEADDMTPEEWCNVVHNADVVKKTATAKAAAWSSPSQSHPSASSSSSRYPRPEKNGILAGGQWKIENDPMEISQEIIDTVTVCNEADRQGAGCREFCDTFNKV